MFMLATAGVLFTPKILGAIHVLRRGAGRFGGAAGLTLSVLTEMLLSSALAPVRMLFHTQFVLAALTNLQLQWKSPPREDAETSKLPTPRPARTPAAVGARAAHRRRR